MSLVTLCFPGATALMLPTFMIFVHLAIALRCLWGQGFLATCERLSNYHASEDSEIVDKRGLRVVCSKE